MPRYCKYHVGLDSEVPEEAEKALTHQSGLAIEDDHKKHKKQNFIFLRPFNFYEGQPGREKTIPKAEHKNDFFVLPEIAEQINLYG